MNRPRIISSSIVVLLLTLPALVLAATTDFTANGNITVPSVTFGSSTADMLILNGSTAQSWSFSSGAFTVTNPGTFEVGSSNGSVKSVQFSSGGSTLACSENTTPGTSFATAPTAAGTYTVTPSTVSQCTSLCSAVSNAVSYNSFPTCGAASCNAGYKLSGSGSSATCVAVGGGGPVGLVESCSAGYTLSGGLCYLSSGRVPSSVSASSSPATTKSSSYGRNLTLGATGNDVIALQNFLIIHGYTIPAGATGYFGSQTQSALVAYQRANGISPAVGYFGPLTRAAIARATISASTTANSGATTAASTPQLSFTRNLQLGDTGMDVKTLQVFLNIHSFTVATTGPGSSGNESDYFGNLTIKALEAFQKSVGIPATGYLGPLTRAAMAGVK